MPAGYTPKSETEKALKNSLRDMEMQCKERVDLLEALKLSRQEKAASDAPSQESNGKIHKTSRTPRPSAELERNEKGYIGDGTIPAASYPDSSRLGPPLPQRPTMVTRNTSDQAVVGRRPSNDEPSPSYASSSISSRTITPSYSATLAPPAKKSSRSPSPDKVRTMRHTLRSGDKVGRKASPRESRSSGGRRENPVTNKAATLAWQSVSKSGPERLGRSLDSEADRSTTAFSDSVRKSSTSDPITSRSTSSQNVRYDKTTRTLVHGSYSHPPAAPTPPDILTGDLLGAMGWQNSYPFPTTDPGQPATASGSMPSTSAVHDLFELNPPTPPVTDSNHSRRSPPPPPPHKRSTGKLEPLSYPTYLNEYPETSAKQTKANTDIPVRRKPAEAESSTSNFGRRKPVAANTSSPRHRDRHQEKDDARRTHRKDAEKRNDDDVSSHSVDDETNSSGNQDRVKPRRKAKQKQKESAIIADPTTPTSDDSENQDSDPAKKAWEEKISHLMKNLPRGVDEGAAKQIFNEIVVKGDEVHWDDVAGLDIAKKALKEAVVYPFLRPDLFMGLREPARGMLLFGPPGTGKTMLARAVATESRSTFFSISASSLTSKYLGESEKLVRALFSLAKALAPSIIFVDEIDSLLSSRSGSGEHEATRRIKTEFLIQWSDLQRAAAGREQSEKEKEKGDASRVLVLAATNLPWAIDEAARRRFVRRQYIPLPEDETRATQLRRLLGHQKHSLGEADIQKLLVLTDGLYPPDWLLSPLLTLKYRLLWL